MCEVITMQHEPATVNRLATVQYRTFSPVSRIGWSGISLVMIAMGFGLIYDVGKPYRYFLLAVGCIIFANIGTSASVKADKTLRAIRQQGGDFPCTKMVFSTSGITVTEKGMPSHTVPYSNIIRTVEDAEYYYLFISTEAAYMVPKAQLKDPMKFRRLLEAKSSKPIVSSKTLLGLNLKDLRRK